jgi:nicotinamidase-related amidase
MNAANSQNLKSSSLLDAAQSVLAVVDVQGKLIELIDQNAAIVSAIHTLVDAAEVLGIPKVCTEQYPAKLGETISELAVKLPERLPKRMFSVRECEAIFRQHWDAGKRSVVICGIESHVCILQSAFDLLAAGWHVYVVANAIGSRLSIDHQLALRRMEIAGIVPVSYEMVLFEWCETSLHPKFREISRLVKGG